MDLVFHNPGSVFPPPGRYTHAVEVPAGQRMIFLSGQVPVALDGKVPETLAGQADQVYANITTILASLGALPSSIIKVTTFLTEGDDGTDCVHQARAKYLGEHRPASTAVFVSRLVDPSWKIEIDAVALLP